MKSYYLLVVSGILLVSCSTATPNPVGQGAGNDLNPFSLDSLVEVNAEDSKTIEDIDISSVDADVPLDSLSPGDVSVDNSGSCPGGSGCPCLANGDCQTELCIDVPGGKACAQPCADACPDGFSCSPVTFGSDIANFCVPRLLHLCDPCANSKDCASLGITGAACVDLSGDGHFCGIPCQGGCPDGYACKNVKNTEGSSSDQCVRSGSGAAAQCPCSDAAKAAKLSTTCATAYPGPENTTVFCPGNRSCNVGGLTACDAPAPVTETCNGQDDDCNGLTDEGDCDDNNACTTDSCAGKEGCKHTALGGACDDGNACTSGDVCTAGVCKSGTALQCNDANPCTQDACLPASGCTNTVLDGQSCDADGDACTAGDACVGKVCTAGPVTGCDDKNACTIDSCDTKSGQCVHDPVTDGVACDDGTLCTVADSCQSGKCKGKAANCDDTNECTADTCLPATGCQHTPMNGPCDDLNPCTLADTCDQGNCAPGKPVACNAGDACMIGKCDLNSGNCSYLPVGPGTPCDDANICTDLDTCSAGNCSGKAKNCDDNNACTMDSCDLSQGCVYAAQSGPCSDGNACTVGDVCGAGKCTGNAIDCDDGNACTQDSCVPASGCSHTTVPVGTPCSDNSQCTAVDVCNGDQCAGVLISCDDGNPCTDDSCDAKAGCSHLANTAPCTDSNACTSGDVCKASLCVGAPVNCADGNVCTLDACDPGLGCIFPAVAGNCDDKNACTSGDSCAAGKCTGSAIVCNDNNVCTLDSCNIAQGCVYTPQSVDCSDSNACTSGDTCSGGVCTGSAMSCDDNNPCTTDSCNVNTGCAHANLADGASCGANLTCQAGVCAANKCTGTLTFQYTGKIESWPIPACAGPVTIEVWGAQGGISSGGGGGLGAKVQGTYNSPGSTLSLIVGQQGGTAPYPAGGGGGSFVANGNTPVLVAGGGGGAYQNWANPGASTILANAGNGTGGAQSNLGGGGGGFTVDGQPPIYGGRSFLNGGAGGSRYPANEANCANGGFGGGGGSSMNGNFNAGGGGGYDGGKSGNGNAATGGSSYINPAVTGSKHTPGTNSGDGKIVLTW